MTHSAGALDRAEISRRVKMLLVQALGLQIDPQEIPDEEAIFGEGFVLDSIATLQVICAVEEDFGIEVDDEDLRVELFNSVRKLSDYVEGKLQ